MTVGTGLTEEFTYPHQLQNILNDQAEPGYEVLNFGVGGYDTLQEVALLENRGLIYKPDLVIIGYCLNDIGIDSLSLEYLERVRKYREDPLFRFRLVQFIATCLDRILLRNWVEEKNKIEDFKRSYAGQIARIGKGEYEIRELMRRSPSQFPSSWYQSEDRIGRLRYAFQHLAATAGRNNFSVMVAVIPWLEENTGSYPHSAANKIVELEAHRAEFATMDLTPEFLRVGMRRLRRIDNDHCHPGAAGQRIIAESLAAQIRSMRLEKLQNRPGR
jgi:lysophospholipase L1-like esterase